MKFTKIAGLFAALMGVAAGEAFAQQTRGAGKAFQVHGVRTTPRRARKYREQSTRQAMRKYRRAQGGPGIYLNEQRGCYLPNGCPTLEDFQDNTWPGARL